MSFVVDAMPNAVFDRPMSLQMTCYRTKFSSDAIKARGGLLLSLINLSTPVISEPYILVVSHALNWVQC